MLSPVYADANFGSPAGPGTAAFPYDTITNAVAHIVNVQGGSGRVVVNPGVYDLALGEVYPIVLPPNIEIVAAQTCAAIIGGSAPGSTTFPGIPFIVPQGSAYAWFEGLQFERLPGTLGYNRAIQVDAGPGDVLFFCVKDCMVAASSQAIDIHATDCIVFAGIDHCRLQALDAVRVQVDNATIDLKLVRSAIEGSSRGLTYSGVNASTGTLLVDRTAFDTCGVVGLRHAADATSATTAEVKHSVFFACGGMVFPPGSAIREAGPSPAAWTIANSAFWQNANELTGIPGGATVVYDLLQSGYPGTGNISGDPLFVDAASGDFHVLPGSPVVDAGTSAVGAVAEDGDLDPMASPPAPDIGLDELWMPYLAVNPLPLESGKTATFTFYGTPGHQVFIAIGPGAVPSFGSGFQLTGLTTLLAPCGTAPCVLPGSGVTTYTFALPPAVFPIFGAPAFGLQGLFVGPFGSPAWSLNAIATAICP